MMRATLISGTSMISPALPALAMLDDLAVLTVTGDDAADFLHRQLSNDVLHIGSSQARWAACCTAQGRMLASMVVWRPAGDSILMIVSRDIAQAFVKRLSMFVLRAKARIALSDDLRVYGAVLTPAAPEALRAAPWTRVADAHGDWISAPSRPGGATRAWLIGAAGLPADTGARQAAWRVADIQAGLPWIRTGTQDLFIPQTLNMDLNGGVDFGKGCYPGQEIIARSHYRGTIKRRMAHGAAPWTDAHALPDPGDDLYIAQGEARPAGRIIDLAWDGQVLHVLAERSVSDAGISRYSLGAPDGPVIELFPVNDAATAD